MLRARGRSLGVFFLLAILVLTGGGGGRATAAEIAWSTYLGGSNNDYCQAVAVDSSGNIYVAGDTYSPGWVAGGFDLSLNYPYYSDAFVVKISSTGQHLWSTYLGGSYYDYGRGIAVDALGNAYVCGSTESSGWVSGGFDTSLNGSSDAFVTKLSPSGGHFWSTFLGGNSSDYGNGIAVDPSGYPCLTGSTYSSDWVSGGMDTSYGGSRDGFAARLSPASGQPVWATYLGGGSEDFGNAIVVDKAGNIAVIGTTSSSNWISGGFKTTLDGYREAYVVKLAPSGGHLWSTYLGGRGTTIDYYYRNTYGQGITVDSGNNLCLAGSTQVSGWVSDGYDTSLNGAMDAFVARLAPDGRHLWSTYLGGNSDDCVNDITVDSSDRIFVAGDTASANWTAGGFDNDQDSYEGFVAMFTSAGQFRWSSYLGGYYEDYARCIDVDRVGAILVGGNTNSSGWVAKGYDTSLAGSRDGFLARITRADQIATGSLTLSIEPEEAAAAGAQWRLAGTAAWHDSGATVSGIPAGNPSIEFKPLPFWIPPAAQTVKVPAGTTAQASASYTAAGALQVMIYPPDAAAAGAQWRRMGMTLWHDGGTSEPAVLPGTYAIEFKPHPDWLGPLNATAIVQARELTEITGVYRRPKADLSWTATLGGINSDEALAVAMDGEGNLIVAGKTASSGWVSGGTDTVYNGGNSDAFVACLSPLGESVWSTYLGGTNTDEASGVAVDGAGNIGVSGTTFSRGWATGGPDATLDGSQDAFAARLSPGGAVLWIRYLGGIDAETGGGIAVDASNNLFITGDTSSPDWLSGGYNTIFGGGTDGFVVKLSPAGELLWGAYLGGQTYGETYGKAIVATPGGNIAITGDSNAAFGFVSGGGDTTPGGSFDTFVVQLNGDGQHLWSTWLGGANNDFGTAIAVDGSNNLCVTGYTCSAGWISGGFDSTFDGTVDAFAIKLASDGRHLWSTYLGGTSTDYGYGIASDVAGNIFVTGDTYSSGWLNGGFDESYQALGDIFMVKLSGGGQPMWSTYLGGSGDDGGRAVAPAGAGLICVAGRSNNDAIVARIKDLSQDKRLGGLAVRIGPPEVVTAGAQWRRTGTTLWRDGGTTASIPPGPCAVEFKDVSNWNTPPRQATVIVDGQTTVITAQYVRHAGSLKVTILPSEAVSLGARWRRVGTSTWLASGATETGIPTGSHSVEFKGVTGSWVTPSAMSVNISKDHLSTLTTGYARAYGNLQVTIHPPEAVAAGARWRRRGTITWLASGYTEQGILTGNYSIEFNTLGGIWRTPPVQAATVVYNQTMSAEATYGYDSGSLAVTITPPEAGAEGAQWRRVGSTTWRASGTTETSVPVGPYQVEYKSINGWVTPPGQTVALVKGQTVRAAGEYYRPGGVLYWDTYVGYNSHDYCNDLAVDSAGNIYACGQTDSAGWMYGGTETTYNGGQDGFVVKINNSGQHLWSTYLGGGAADSAQGVAVDGSGNCIVTGYSNSTGWVWGGTDTSQNGSYDAFVVKLNGGGQPLWSTYLGGTNKDYGRAVATDKAGNIFVAGNSISAGWITGGYDTAYGGGGYYTDRDGFYGGDGFVVKLAPAGAYLWGTYMGGSDDEFCRALAVDTGGNPWAVGTTRSSGWVRGGEDTSFSGYSDAFVVKLSSAGQHLWSTYMGGSAEEEGYAVAGNGLGDIIVVGSTVSTGWTSGDYDVTYGGSLDGFVARLSGTGKQIWSSYLGSNRYDRACDVATDSAGNIYVTGSTETIDWMANGADLSLGGNQDAFVTKLSLPGQHLWSTCLGGSSNEYGQAVCLDPSGNILVAGITESSGWVSGGYDTNYGGNNDGFVARMRDGSARSLGSLRVTLTPSVAATTGARWRLVGSNFWMSSNDTLPCVGAGIRQVEFKDISPDWLTPARISVRIEPGKTMAVTVGYKSRLVVTVQSTPFLHAEIGQSMLIALTASGLQPILFQWKKDGVPIAGATGTTFYIPAARLTDAGVYTCEVRNAAAFVESPPFRFIVHNGTPVLVYLLGYSNDPAGLDKNGDGKIDVADVVAGIGMTPPQAPERPNPANAAQGVSRTPRLDWADGLRVANYDVYLWPKGTARPAAPSAKGLAASEWRVSTALKAATTYQWQVVAHAPDPAVTTSGPVWVFTTTP